MFDPNGSPSFNTTTSGDDFRDCDINPIKLSINWYIGVWLPLEIGFAKSVAGEPASNSIGRNCIAGALPSMYAFSAGKTINTYTRYLMPHLITLLSCSVCITVADDENPSIICPDTNIITVNQPGRGVWSIIWRPVVSRIVQDNCTESRSRILLKWCSNETEVVPTAIF